MRRANGGLYVPSGIDEARADHEVCRTGSDRSEQLPELGRVVLAVAVEPDRNLVSLVARVPEPRLDGSADADVEQEPEHGGSVRFGRTRRRIGRRVVDDDHDHRSDRTP